MGSRFPHQDSMLGDICQGIKDYFRKPHVYVLPMAVDNSKNRELMGKEKSQSGQETPVVIYGVPEEREIEVGPCLGNVNEAAIKKMEGIARIRNYKVVFWKQTEKWGINCGSYNARFYRGKEI